MGRDVEADLIANDKTGRGIDSAERRFRASSKRIKSEGDKVSSGFAKSVIGLAEAISPKLAGSLTKAFASAGEAGGPLMLAGVAAATLAAAPLIGATISAGVIGGAGLGGVIGGLILASKDARVRSAADEMSKRLQDRLAVAGQSFVQPAIDGIHDIETAVDSINVEQILGDSAKFVQPLAEGVSSAITELGDGIEQLVHNAGPVIDVIGEGIADIGKSLGDGLKSLSDNGDDAASALRLIFLIITTGLDSVFLTVNALTEMYGIIKDIGGLGVFGPLSEDMDKAAKSGRDLGTGTFSAARHIGDMGDSAVGAANGVQSLAEQLDAVTSAGRSLFESTTNVGEAIDRVTEAAKKNGKTLDANTTKGRANREVLSGLASALSANYQATLAANGLGPKTDAVAAANRANFIRLATSLTGSKRAAEDLANKILGIPEKKDTKINANTHDAEGRIKALKDKLDAIRDRTVTVTVRARNVTGSSLSDSALNSALRKNFAAGDYWAGADTNGGDRSRTGGPVSVSNSIDVTVMLDGQVIGAQIDSRVRASEKRQQHRQQVSAR